jgi:hypothetical protein
MVGGIQAALTLAVDCGRVTGNPEVIGWPSGLVRETRISSVFDFVTRSRLVGTDPYIASWITSGLPTNRELVDRRVFIQARKN